jgi:hypothetical protein
MIFVLSGMVGYLYWQQTRMMQHLNSISIVISTHFSPRPVEDEDEEEEPVKEEEKQEEPESEEEDDDRVSVKDEVEHVEGPKDEDKVDVDDLQDKTAAQLRDLLTKKGIPFGKRDPKTVLIQLLKATA